MSASNDSLVIDDFSDNDLSEYQVIAGNPELTNFDGESALQVGIEISSGEELVSPPDSGLANYPAQGDRFEFFVNFNGVDGGEDRDMGFMFGLQDSNNWYRAMMGQGDNDVRISKLVDNDKQIIASESKSLPKDEWLVGVVDWSTDGTIRFSIERLANRDTTLVSVETSDDTWSTGGIGWRATDNRGKHSYFGGAWIGSNPEDPDEPNESVTASVATVQFIPGDEENVSKGGNPLNSALMHVFDDATKTFYEPSFSEGTDGTLAPSVEMPISVGPVLDSWYYGDMKDEIAVSLEEATRPKPGKYFDALEDESHENYRHKNGIEISFDVSDGSIEQDSIQIEFNESGTAPDDDRISFGGDTNPYSVMVNHEVNGIPYEDWFGEAKRQANQEPRFYSYDTEFEVDGVDAVRVLTISGGYVGFGEEIASRSADDPIDFFSTVWDWDLPDYLAKAAMMGLPLVNPLIEWLTVVPRTWSFIEFIVVADGRRYARVWDASQYPSLFTYVDGERQQMDKMPYRPQERFNTGMIAFFARALADLTPYQGSVRNYFRVAENPDQLESEMEDELQRTDRSLPIGFSASNLLPTVPRATVGLESEGGPELTEPAAPFDSNVSMPSYEIIKPE